MDLTYNQVINIFKQIKEQHPNINDFEYGDVEKIGAREYTYPFMYINPVSIVLKEHSSDIHLQVIIMDLLKSDLSNEQEVHSDMLSLASQVRTAFKEIRGNEYDGIRINQETIAIPFSTKYVDVVGGVNMQFKFEAELSTTLCGITNLFSEGEING